MLIDLYGILENYISAFLAAVIILMIGAVFLSITNRLSSVLFDIP